MSMWTYFFQSTYGGPIKIGKTGTTGRAPEDRLQDLYTKSPLPIQIVGAVNRDIERELHQRFAKDRTHGEWFAVTDELIAFIRENTDPCYGSTEPKKTIEKIEGTPIRSILASRKCYAEWTCDRVFENDEDLYDKILGQIDWDLLDADHDCDPDEHDDEPTTVYECVENMTLLVDGNKFVERVGVNTDTGLVLFACGLMNSQSRRQLLDDLADCAGDADGITGSWDFNAVFHDGSRFIWSDLRLLYMMNFARITTGTRIYEQSAFADADSVIHKICSGTDGSDLFAQPEENAGRCPRG